MDQPNFWSMTKHIATLECATTEVFAMPLKFNPKIKHYCAPFAGNAEFDAHPNGFSSSATVIKNPRMLKTCYGLLHSLAIRLNLCLPHCCHQIALSLHSQAYSATPTSCILPLYRTHFSWIPHLGQAKLISPEP